MEIRNKKSRAKHDVSAASRGEKCILYLGSAIPEETQNVLLKPHDCSRGQ